MTKQHIKEQQRSNAHKLQPKAPDAIPTKWIAPKNYRPERSKTTLHKQYGAREMARRKHQIECGQLKAENGLVA